MFTFTYFYFESINLGADPDPSLSIYHFLDLLEAIYKPGLQNLQDHGTAGPRKKLTPQKMFITKKLKK